MIELERVGWENGTLVSLAKVNVQGTVYDVEPEIYSGNTPLSAELLKEMEDNTEKAVNEGVDEATILSNTYSTTETRIGTWIDGKPIYRKVLTGTLPTGSGENIFTISNAKIINFNGIIKSIYNQWWTIPAIHSDDNYKIYTYISGDRAQLNVNCGSYFSTKSQYEIIIEYTKTTD